MDKCAGDGKHRTGEREELTDGAVDSAPGNGIRSPVPVRAVNATSPCSNLQSSSEGTTGLRVT